MMNTERQQNILRVIRRQGRATVAELSELFDVSEATVRRDLASLAEAGAVLRAHGGAVAAQRSTPEPPVIQRMVDKAEEKGRIGRAAAALVQAGETVFIGSGTTTLEVAHNLVHRDNLTVITNALNIANVFADKSNVTLIVVGGLLRHSELSMVGHIAEQAIKELYADKVIMGMRAISAEHGLTSDYLPETMTDRAIIQSAGEIILVADHSKFGKVSTALVAPISAIHRIVTDSAAPAATVAELKRLGIAVTLA